MSCFPLTFKNLQSQNMSCYKTFHQSDCFDGKTKNELANESNFVKIQYFQEFVKPCSDNTKYKKYRLNIARDRTKLDQKARYVTYQDKQNFCRLFPWG